MVSVVEPRFCSNYHTSTPLSVTICDLKAIFQMFLLFTVMFNYKEKLSKSFLRSMLCIKPKSLIQKSSLRSKFFLLFMRDKFIFQFTYPSNNNIHLSHCYRTGSGGAHNKFLSIRCNISKIPVP